MYLQSAGKLCERWKKSRGDRRTHAGVSGQGSEQNMQGEIPIQTVKEKLDVYYKEASKQERDETMECDIVSARIVEPLESGTVYLSPAA